MIVRRRAFEVMGTVVSLALRGRYAEGPEAEAAWAEVTASLRRVDELFSTYRPDSVVNRWGRGELALVDAPPELTEVLTLAEVAREASGGAFDIEAVRSPYGGGPDPSGVVKGWAVRRASAALDRLAATDYCLSAGGDLLCRTRVPGAPAWRIGIEDPADPRRLVAVVPVADGAVATSGSAHRGDHIRDPRTGTAPAGLRQVTVVAPDLVAADIEATTAFVLGERGVPWLLGRGRSGVVVAADGTAATYGADPLSRRWPSSPARAARPASSRP
ncbi:FAD:protein FMN transferase [Nocardioides nitrophenolicus]|uniref:FAD:protein FMN transferase n=1 Tax=Nocardioides nitrophenolicus TaxID=60489 RepID=UPI0027DE7CDC|nr:FAD:protein FMN transferase [Nocardioides nitrophenolicus]MBM7516252.1 thiamine biosynthesis lipoprotein [Nocardioides nitrophenolicus]